MCVCVCLTAGVEVVPGKCGFLKALLNPSQCLWRRMPERKQLQVSESTFSVNDDEGDDLIVQFIVLFFLWLSAHSVSI